MTVTDSNQEASRKAEPVPALSTEPSGARSGVLIGAASVLAIGLNYAFLLSAGRLLGSDDYGALAALLGLLTVVLLPTGALQLAVSREVSRRLALGDGEGADGFARAALRLGLIATGPLVALALAFVVPLQRLLNIESRAAVAMAVSGLVVALAFPIAIGVLQGYQRFRAVAAMYVLPFGLRLALLALVAGSGYRLGGAVLAAVGGAIVSAAVAVVLLRESLRRGARATRPALRPFLRYLWPVVVGLIGIAVLTNVDLLVVKARFSSDEAGDYAAASAFARVAFFLPATILAVLFPRTAARQARGEETADILGRSLIVTGGLGVLVTLLYGMAGRGLVHTSFGPEFAEGGELLVLFTVSMVLFAFANLLVGFHLSRGETLYAWLVAGVVPLQIGALATVPNSVRGVIWTDIAIGIALLASHELVVGSSIPALRAGLSHFRRNVPLSRRVAAETLVVVVGTAAFVCLLFWPVVAHPGSTVLGWSGSDSAGGIWWLWRLQQDGYHVFGTTYHTITGAPFGWEEGNGLNLQWLLPYYPAYLVTAVVGEIAALNLVSLSGFVLSGATMYLLVRSLGCVPAVSAWAALVYIVFPRHVLHAQHAAFAHIEVLALVVLALIATVRRPTWSRFVLLGLAILACWLTSGYFGVMAAIGAVAFSVGVVLTSRSRKGAMVMVAAISSALAASVLVAGFSMLGGIGRDAGLSRDVGDVSRFGLRPHELVVPPLEMFDEVRETRRHQSNSTETANYVGLLTIAFLAVWLVAVWRRRENVSPVLRSVTAGLVGMALASLLFALPSPVALFGHSFRTPSGFLFEVVPPMRIPSRWILLLMTALVPLAALGMQALWRSYLRDGQRRPLAFAAVAAAMLVSFVEFNVAPGLAPSYRELLTSQAFAREPSPENSSPRVWWYRTDPPAYYAALDRTPAGIVAEYPLVHATDDAEQVKQYLFWQRIHGRRILNGAPLESRADEARRVLVDPGALGAAEQLAFLGVTSIITRAIALDFEEDVPDVPDASWGTGYSLVARFPDRSSVWRVTARPAPALVTLPSGFDGPMWRESDGGFVGYPLSTSSSSGTIEFTATKEAVVRLVLDVVGSRGATTRLRFRGTTSARAFELQGRGSISLHVRIPRGRSQIWITRSSRRAGAEEVVFRPPRAVLSPGRPPELRARLVSTDPGF